MKKNIVFTVTTFKAHFDILGFIHYQLIYVLFEMIN